MNSLFDLASFVHDERYNGNTTVAVYVHVKGVFDTVSHRSRFALPTPTKILRKSYNYDRRAMSKSPVTPVPPNTTPGKEGGATHDHGLLYTGGYGRMLPHLTRANREVAPFVSQRLPNLFSAMKTSEVDSVRENCT